MLQVCASPHLPHKPSRRSSNSKPPAVPSLRPRLPTCVPWPAALARGLLQAQGQASPINIYMYIIHKHQKKERKRWRSTLAATVFIHYHSAAHFDTQLIYICMYVLIFVCPLVIHVCVCKCSLSAQLSSQPQLSQALGHWPGLAPPTTSPSVACLDNKHFFFQKKSS